MDTVKELHKTLANYSVDAGFPDESLGLRCCNLALQALDSDCYGVGALLFDKERKVLAKARNGVFQDGFHFAAHAEMLAVDYFEANYPAYPDRDKLTLMVSLEPCPMCLTRLLISGIGRVIYLVGDHDGGMVHLLDRMRRSSGAIWPNFKYMPPPMSHLPFPHWPCG